MTPLHRHQIAWLSHAGWQRVLAHDWDVTALECLSHWAKRRLPVVVTRQPPDAEDGGSSVALGLSAPRRWQRQRIALRVPRADVLYFDEFPQIDQVRSTLPRGTRKGLRELHDRLFACGTAARVYGSHGWQHFAGLEYVHDASDLDLWVAVSSIAQADAVAAALGDFASPGLRIDGELMFGGDAGVAWREWRAWRAGRTGAFLVKRLAGASMARSLRDVQALEFDEAAA